MVFSAWIVTSGLSRTENVLSGRLHLIALQFLFVPQQTPKNSKKLAKVFCFLWMFLMILEWLS